MCRAGWAAHTKYTQIKYDTLTHLWDNIYQRLATWRRYLCGEEALQIGMDWCAVGDTDKLVDFVELVYADKTRKGLLIVSEMDKLEVTPGNFGVNKCGGLGSCFEL